MTLLNYYLFSLNNVNQYNFTELKKKNRIRIQVNIASGNFEKQYLKKCK